VYGDEIIKSVIGHKRARGRGSKVLGLHLGFTAPSRPYVITDLFCEVSSTGFVSQPSVSTGGKLGKQFQYSG
jgi:hypothetical protein